MRTQTRNKRTSVGYEDEEKKKKREMEERINSKSLQLRQEADKILEQERVESQKGESTQEIQEVDIFCYFFFKFLIKR